MSVSMLERSLEVLLTAGLAGDGKRSGAPGHRADAHIGRWRTRSGRAVSMDVLLDPGQAPSAAQLLREALTGVGLDAAAVESFAQAAETVGALTRGVDLAAASGGADDHDLDVHGAVADGRDEAAVDLAVRTAAAGRVLDCIGALVSVSSRLDAAVLAAARDLTARHGGILLARKGVTDPGELTPGQRDKWRARAKSATRHEIEALTGWGSGEVVDLVGLANAPRAVSAVVATAMRGGVMPWRLARRFWRECGALAHEDAAHIANTLFGTDPDIVATERLTPDGELSDEPWRHREFYTALEREVVKVKGRDPAACRERREQARAARDCRASIGDDGTGCLVITGLAEQVAAIIDRLERAARKARKLGDARTLAQLRADTALALLMHGTLCLPDAPEDPDLVTVEYTDALAKVLNALPAAVLNVIVPYSAFHDPTTTPADPTTARSEPASAQPTVGPVRAARASSACWPDERAPDDHPPRCEARAETLTVGQVQGAFPMFLSPDQVRDLALVPGTVLHRLLVDPVTGRCVERSVTAYRPDAAMRAQILAADLTCRAPGCVRHGSLGQYDHVHEFDEGGPTAETNLQVLDQVHHDLKTRRFWDAVLDQDRNVTWTTLLGKVYRTRAHDYRQYTTVLSDAITDVNAAPEAERADAVSRAVYAALCYRDAASALHAEDDDTDAELDSRFCGWELIALTHTTSDGRIRQGPAQEQQQVWAEHHRDDRSGGESPATDTDTSPWRLAARDDEPPPF